jgi:hypothetical protein
MNLSRAGPIGRGHLDSWRSEDGAKEGSTTGARHNGRATGEALVHVCLQAPPLLGPYADLALATGSFQFLDHLRAHGLLAADSFVCSLL